MEKPIIFKNQRGKNLLGILHLPEGNKKFPLVVFCHGFGDTKTQKKLIKLSRNLVKNGIASFRFDFEGCGDSEGDFLKATISNEIMDLYSAINYLKKINKLNFKKLAFVGHSAGNLIYALFLEKSKVDAEAAVMWAPAFNQKALMKYWANPKEIKQWKSRGYLYRKGKEKIIGIDYLKENINKDYTPVLKNLKIPILIFHGGKDDTVSWHFSRDLVKKYKNIKFIYFKQAEHKFEDYYIQKELVSKTTDWLKSFLL